MDPMTDEDATPVEGRFESSGGMRVVMLNARTAVLVPVDAPDQVPGNGDMPWQDATDTGADGSLEGSAGESPAQTDDATGAGSDWSEGIPDIGEAVTDAPTGAGLSDRDLAEPDGGPDEPPDATAMPSADTAAAADRTGSDLRWRAELLARLDDLGRLLERAAAPAPAPADTMTRLTADIARLDQRLTAALADIAARVDALEEAVAVAKGTVPAGLDTDEAISDLRMQLRMVEVQVGTLGKLIVSTGPDEASAPDGLRTRLAELMAREQRLASGA